MILLIVLEPYSTVIVAGVRINFGQVAQLTSIFSKGGSYLYLYLHKNHPMYFFLFSFFRVLFP